MRADWALLEAGPSRDRTLNILICIFVFSVLFQQITTCTQPHQSTSWALNQSWCAALLSPYAPSSRIPGLTVRCDVYFFIIYVWTSLSLHWTCWALLDSWVKVNVFSLLYTRAPFCLYGSDAREWQKWGGRWRQGLLVLQWDSCGVRLLQQTDGLPGGPRLQGDKELTMHVLILNSSIHQHNSI